MTRPIGFSTGALRRIDLSFADRIRAIVDVGASAIELVFFAPEELETLQELEAVRDLLGSFSYISVHAPFRDMRYRGGDAQTEDVLRKLRDIVAQAGAKTVTMHPDVIEDIALIQESGLPAALENLTMRHRAGQSPAAMAKLFAKAPSLRLTFDVNHAFEVDPSGRAAEEYRERFGGRIAHLHISSMRPGRRHTTYHDTDHVEHFPVIGSLTQPIIHEGYLDAREDLDRELRYVREKLAEVIAVRT